MKKNLFAFIFLFVLIITGTVFNPGCKKTKIAEDYSFTGTKWILQSIQYSNVNILSIVRSYWIVFNEDGSLVMMVDCNNCGGSYALGDNGSISFPGPFICTEIACGPDTKDKEFHAALGSASRYDVNGNMLYIYFNNDQSRLNFIAD